MSDQLQTEPTAASNAQRRGQAVAGAIAGVVVVLVLIGVFVGIKLAGDDKSDDTAAALPAPVPSAAGAAPSQEAAPSEAPSAPAEQPTPPASLQTPAALKSKPKVTAGKGALSALKVTYLVKGKGAKVTAGEAVTTNYVLVSYKTGEVIDTSWDRGQTFTYKSGTGDIIKGFDQGLNGVPVGSRVQLDVPAALAYGAQQGDLRFVVDVLDASKA
jgi:peptidylprolyl isomerase